MNEPLDAPARDRYLVHAVRGAPLNEFLAQARADADIVVVDLIGPRDAPHTAVLEIDAATARRLQLQFSRNDAPPSQQLTIEPDRPLSMFDSGAAGPL